MNSTHSVKLRQKTAARLRSMAADLDTSVTALIKHAVEQGIDEAWTSGVLSLPIRTRGKTEPKDGWDSHTHLVRLDPATEARLRSIVVQRPLLKSAAIVRGAIEQFVEHAHRDEHIAFTFRPEIVQPVPEVRPAPPSRPRGGRPAAADSPVTEMPATVATEPPVGTVGGSPA